ncbi:myo-inositol-1-monophosphatase [Mycobacterium haemophilum]|uniref:inositol-phosphate phosphatase n=2 Tax=Mycobacterium haemophilum TaxID=29311 RepID=A0A0I9UQR2_9MYCO|nr:inositol monophosphatase family protein [Mycobacterium haemophilum]KLO28410.1 myo-inositol-1-monophosphatase [Mycobacterium haemophilum]KLO37451.1 myo-inositol-1-monophosphatase [Mycobacterium haemophilum]KLO44000.1 myo-inositol-1-monophosphatase [Mycobacterium haemophilum]KLO49280.1 myo-inositol-1-monophosphatase [Mycobacterium haemophilum]
MNNHELFETAWQATQIGAETLASAHPVSVRKKGDRDLVTDVDLRIQRDITDYLTHTTPQISVYGEESSDQPDLAAAELLWVLDPIDGTSNFVHGLPLCAVSLALLHHGEPLIAITRAPLLNRTYHAIKNEGAYLNGEAIAASGTTDLVDAIVSMGDYAVGHEASARNQRRLGLTAALVPRVERIRMFGAATLDLAFVAEGATDACVIMSNQPWDTAAGTLIAREAGATITDADANPHTHQSSSTIASAPRIVQQLTSIIEAANTPGSQQPHQS